MEKLTLTQLSMSDMWFSICKRKEKKMDHDIDEQRRILFIPGISDSVMNSLSSKKFWFINIDFLFYFIVQK